MFAVRVDLARSSSLALASLYCALVSVKLSFCLELLFSEQLCWRRLKLSGLLFAPKTEQVARTYGMELMEAA